MEIYCSTGAFVGRINNRNHMLIPEAAKKVDCDGFEFMVCNSWYENFDKICQDIKGTNFPVIHLDKDIGEFLSRNTPSDREAAFMKFRENCRVAKLLGCKKSVLHLWGGLPSDGHMESNFSAYPELKKISEDYEILLTVENIPCNTYDPLTHWRELIKIDPDVKFTVDTRFLAFHGQFDEFYQGEFMSRIEHVHVSDWSADIMEWAKLRPIPHPGEGFIDFKEFFTQMVRFDYEGSVTLESPSMLEKGLDSESLNADLEYVREIIAGIPRAISLL